MDLPSSDGANVAAGLGCNARFSPTDVTRCTGTSAATHRIFTLIIHHTSLHPPPSTLSPPPPLTSRNSRSTADVTAALDLAAKAFGPVTVAVNCAGIAIASKTLGKSGLGGGGGCLLHLQV